MGINVGATISYGIKFEEGFEFPWDIDLYNGDFEEWWQVVGGYTPTFKPFDDSGEYKEGVNGGDPRISEYFKELSAWEEENPFPVDIHMCGSDECYEIVLSAPGLSTGASWDKPEVLDLSIFTFSQFQKDLLLINFCKEYGIDHEGERPEWYITCLYS